MVQYLYVFKYLPSPEFGQTWFNWVTETSRASSRVVYFPLTCCLSLTNSQPGWGKEWEMGLSQIWWISMRAVLFTFCHIFIWLNLNGVNWQWERYWRVWHWHWMIPDIISSWSIVIIILIILFVVIGVIVVVLVITVVTTDQPCNHRCDDCHHWWPAEAPIWASHDTAARCPL